MATTKRTVDVALATTGVDERGRPVRTPLVTDASGSAIAVEEPPMLEPELGGEHMLINIGPQHPATHGVLRLVLELDGETGVVPLPHRAIFIAGPRIGKSSVQPKHSLDAGDTSLDRQQLAFALGAERLFGLEITERFTVLRVTPRAVPDHLALGG